MCCRQFHVVTMPALNFQPRFADLVARGKKRQTIRPVRRRPIKAGDLLHLYTGMRTKGCRKLGEAVCTNVVPALIENYWIFGVGFGTEKAIKEGPPDLLGEFAQRDGFDSWPEMREWFKKIHGLPFEGVLIAW